METENIRRYFLDPNNWAIWGGRLFKALLIILLARLLLTFGARLIERAVRRDSKGKLLHLDDRRSKTLAPLMQSVLRYVVDVVAVLSLLEIFLPAQTIQPILASAGVVGLAIGFGAQSLVRDIISGFFILYEDQFGVGDYIRTAGREGIVQDLGLRITRMRDFTGELHIIPNGQIDVVTNLSRGQMRALVDVAVAYEESLPHVLDVLREVSRQVGEERRDVVLEGPEVLGLVNFGPSELVIRIIAQTRPMEQWAVERQLRARILEAFEREGIEIPYPRQVFLQGSRTETAAPGSAGGAAGSASGAAGSAGGTLTGGTGGGGR